MSVAGMRRQDSEIDTVMQAIGTAAKDAARQLATVPTEKKNAALRFAAQAVRARSAEILAANARDLASATERGLGKALLDRLTLNPDRIEGMAKGLDEVAALGDPVGETIAEWDRPNGLHIARVRQPLGVTVVGGLLVSQLLTLFITPVVYIWFDKLTGMRFSPGWAKRWRLRGRGPTAPATPAE